MIIVKNGKGDFLTKKVGNISNTEIVKLIETKAPLTKLPLPMEALVYPKNDKKMKTAATTMIHEVKKKTPKLGEVSK